MKREKKHSVKFNAVMNILLTTSTMIINVVMIPYVTRTLSVEGCGNVNFAQALSSWLSSLCLVGVPTYGLRECSRVRDDPIALAQVVKELLTIITIFTVAVLSGFAICIIFVPRLASLALLMWMFLVGTLILSYGVEWYFQAMEQYEYITVRSIIFKVLSFVATLLLVRRPDDWLIYGAIMALVTCGNNLFNIVKLLHDVPLWNLGRIDLRRHVRPLISYAILSMSSAIYLAFDSVLLGMLNANNIQVALYQLAAKLKNVCFSVVNAIVGVLIPRLSYYAKNEQEKYDGLLARGLGILLNLCIGIIVYLILFAQPLVILISSSKYSAATVPVQIIGVVNFCCSMSYFLGLCILSPLGREREFASANLLGVPISLVFNILLDGHFGAVGAAFSMLMAEVVIFLRQAYSCRDILSRVFTVKKLLRTGLPHVLACLIALGTSVILRYAGIGSLSTGDSAILVIVGFFSYSFTWLVSAAILHEDSSLWMIDVAKNMWKKISLAFTRQR